MERLKTLRVEKGLYQKDIASFLGVDRTTYVKYERGDSEPSFEIISKLANFFEVSIDYLLGNDRPSHKGIKIPVLGSIPAGVPIEAIEDILDWEEIPESWTAGGKEYFCLKIKGNSMYPKYLDGDTVIFLRAATCDSGQDAAVMVNGDNATFKKVIKRADGVMLQPINVTEFEPLFYSNEEIETLPVCVIGVAKEIRRTV